MGEDIKKEKDIKKLVEENIKLSEEILEISKKTKRYIFFQQIYGVIKLLIIVVPIILGIIYLPPLLEDALSQYTDLLGGVGSSSDLLESLQ
jgi:hypothetical protein